MENLVIFDLTFLPGGREFDSNLLENVRIPPLFIRQAGVQYLSNDPKRFIENNTENSWNECIKIMSMQGTWCNALFVQAVADCQNAAILSIL